MKTLLFGILIQLFVPAYFEENTAEKYDPQEQQNSNIKLLPPGDYPRNYQREVKQGNMADMFPSNKHRFIPPEYSEFSRRFVPYYQYVEKKQPKATTDELSALQQLDMAIKQALNNKRPVEINEINAQDQVDSGGGPFPKRAAPDVVLDVAADAAVREANKADNPDEKEAVKSSMRSGNYWNALWKEDVPFPEKSLRSDITKPRLDTVRVKIMPGSKLYQLVNEAKKISPQLLYVIKNRIF